MNKYIIPVGAVLVLAVIITAIFFAATNNSDNTSNTNNTLVTTTPTATSVITTVASNVKYKDGTYSGNAATNRWGAVQVEVTIAGSKITDIKFLTLPSGERESVQRSNFASPILKQEAIQKQGATVDIVSGATDTSISFMQSMSTALAKAI